MFDYDPYEQDHIPRNTLNCFQAAVTLAVKHKIDEVYWVPDYEHYYLVIPKEPFALGELAPYPKLTSKFVLEHGQRVEITPNDIATWT